MATATTFRSLKAGCIGHCFAPSSVLTQDGSRRLCCSQRNERLKPFFISLELEEKMVIFVRSNEVNPDPRVQKYVDFMDSKGIPYKVLAWNRSGDTIKKENFVHFKLRAKYGAGLRNIPKKILWCLFVLIHLVKHKNEYSVVHGCDFDGAFPAFLAQLITGKKYIFDVFDWIDDGGNTWISKTIYWLQSRVAANSHTLILCEEERKEQVNVFHGNILVLPNIPNTQWRADATIIKEIQKQRLDYELVVSYVGVFDSNRGLDDLLQVASRLDKVCFNFAGFGRHEGMVVEAAARLKNVKYWGKVDYNTGLNIMGCSDLIMALYYLANPVHRYAAPNKFYESLMLGVPVVTTQGTLVGDKVLKYKTGFVVQEGEPPLYDLFALDNLRGEIEVRSKNAEALWEAVYKDYVVRFMEDEYVNKAIV